MSKELVEEARGRPPKEKAVIEEAMKLFSDKKKEKTNLEEYQNRIEHCKNRIDEIDKKVDLLKKKEYKIEPSDYRKGDFNIIYPEK